MSLSYGRKVGVPYKRDVVTIEVGREYQTGIPLDVLRAATRKHLKRHKPDRTLLDVKSCKSLTPRGVYPKTLKCVIYTKKRKH